MKPIENLGILDGTILLFGGVYSNLQAIQGIREIAETLNIPNDRVICTGDVVAYCADPEESLREVIDWGIHTIAGNVEIQLRDGLEDCGCNFSTDSRCDIFAKQWYPYAQKKVSDQSLDWMHQLPEFIQFQYGSYRCTVVHGSYFNTSEYVFKSTPWDIKAANFEATQSNVIIAGHCGLPFNDVQQDQYWLNPGVIGIPANDGTTRVWYMLLHPSDGKLNFEHRSFEFDYEETFARMLETELPISYAKTLTSGLWDNNDILPEEETIAQGLALAF